MAQIGQDISFATSLLRDGKVVAIPTETVYGLAGNALNTSAVASIFEAKNRPTFDPLIVHLSSIDELYKYAIEIPEDAIKLAKHFWPGPLTLLLKRNETIPDLVTSGSSLCAFRVPNHPITLDLLNALPFPLAAPSANPFGYVSPTTAVHVNKQLGEVIPYILDGGNCKVGVESTIVSFEEDGIHLLRAGGLSIEDIESCIGKSIAQIHTSSSKPAAPGMLDSHYATRKPLYVGTPEELNLPSSTTAVMGLSAEEPYANYFPLSTTGDLKEAARNLFATMRALDETDFEAIIALPFPMHGLGRAINDRLKRAAHK